MNIGVQISLQDNNIVSFGYMPRRGIAGLCDSSIFNFLRNLHIVSVVAVPVCIPTNSTQEFFFLYILTSIYYLLFFFYHKHLTRCEVISLCGFVCIFLMISYVEHLFMYLLAIYMSSLGNYLFTFFAHFLLEVFLLVDWSINFILCAIELFLEYFGY